MELAGATAIAGSVQYSRITISTKFIFHIVARPIRPVSEKPLFSLRERIPTALWFQDAAVKVAIVGECCPTCLGRHTSSVGGESHSCENLTTRHYKYLHKVRSALLASASNKNQKHTETSTNVTATLFTTNTEDTCRYCDLLSRRKL